MSARALSGACQPAAKAKPERADELFFLAPVFAEETFEFLGEFIA